MCENVSEADTDIYTINIAMQEITWKEKVMWKIGKYTFIPFFVMMLYAAIMGRDGLQKYPIGDEKLLIEEYYIIIGLFVLYDIIKYAIQRR